MNTLQTSEASILSSIWVFASMINKELIWKVFTPVQQFEAENWLDAIFNDWDTLYLMQFKLYKDIYKIADISRLRKQILLIKDFIDSNKVKAKNLIIIPLIVYWWFSELDTDNDRVRLNFKKINYTKLEDFEKEYEQKRKDPGENLDLIFNSFWIILEDIKISWDIFDNYIYSPYNDLIEIKKVLWKYWLDWVLIFSKSWNNSKTITKIENINDFKQEIKDLEKLNKLNNETKIQPFPL